MAKWIGIIKAYSVVFVNDKNENCNCESIQVFVSINLSLVYFVTYLYYLCVHLL